MLGILIIIALVPLIKIIANYMSTTTTDTTRCLVAVILIQVIYTVLSAYIPNQPSAVLVSILVAGVVYMFALEMTYIKSLVISVAHMALTYALAIVFGVLVGFLGS